MNKNGFKDKIKKWVDSDLIKRIIYAFGVLMIAAIIFQAGIFVGFRRVSFGRDWSKNYERNFGPIQHGLGMMGGTYDTLPNAHGVIGNIINIELPTMIVSGQNGVEKVVLIKEDTIIHLMRENISKDKLALGDDVVILGDPNSQGQIEAKLIRVMQVSLTNTTSTNNTISSTGTVSTNK